MSREQKKNSFCLGPSMFYSDKICGRFSQAYFTSVYFGWFPLPCSLPMQVALEFIVALIKISHSGQQMFLLQVS